MIARARRRAIFTASLGALAAAVVAGRAMRVPPPVHVVVGDDGQLSAVLRGGGSRTDLAPGFANVAEPECSFDGMDLLFAGKRTRTDAWQIWEVRRDGYGLRRVTTSSGDCRAPHYLPQGRLLYTAHTADGDSLMTADLGSGTAEPITPLPEPIASTAVLPDGRVLYERGGNWLTVNNDGTGMGAWSGTDEEARRYALRFPGGSLLTAPRPAPAAHVSVTGFKKSPTGLLFCLSVYNSTNPALRALPDGSARKVRFLADGRADSILGEAPVERDGSFLVRLPADRPLRMQILDIAGRVLAEDKQWIWLRANESRGCIGCHESPSLAPQNRVPIASLTLPHDVGISPGARSTGGPR